VSAQVLGAMQAVGRTRRTLTFAMPSKNPGPRRPPPAKASLGASQSQHSPPRRGSHLIGGPVRPILPSPDSHNDRLPSAGRSTMESSEKPAQPLGDEEETEHMLQQVRRWMAPHV
jgi:hypothetical protein